VANIALWNLEIDIVISASLNRHAPMIKMELSVFYKLWGNKILGEQGR
jgi:hypothetical protein